MTVILWLIGGSLIVALIGLYMFFWAVRSGQYDDLKGASMRILYDDGDVADGTKLTAQASKQAYQSKVPN